MDLAGTAVVFDVYSDMGGARYTIVNPVVVGDGCMDACNDGSVISEMY